MQSGIWLPPYLGEDKGGVDLAWDEMAKVLFQFSYVSGISTSDAFVEKWVAKRLIKTNQIDRFESVTEYVRANPAHAAQWGRRMTTSVRKFARHDTYLSFYTPMAYVIGAAAGHLTPMYPTHRKDADILASHRLMADIRNYMASSAGYDEKKRLREAIVKVQKAINDGRSEPPVPFRDPFVYVSDEKVRTVVDGKQPEPQDVNIDELQSVHHAAQGPGPKQEPVIKGGKGKGKKGEKGGKGDSPSDPRPKSGEASGKGSGKGDSSAVPKKGKAEAGPTPMEVAQPKKSWVGIAVEGARPSAKAKTTPAPKAEPKGKATPVPEAKSAQASRDEPKETKRADSKVEVKKEKGSGDDAPGDSRGSAEKQKRERKSRWGPEVPAKESTKREASQRPDDVDSRPGAAAREASGDDLHSALGRSSVKDAVAPLTASKAMARKPKGSEVRLRSAERVAASPVEGHFRTPPDASTVDAFLAMSSNMVLARQVRGFIRNGEEGGVGSSQPACGKLPCSGHVGVRMSLVRPPEGPLGLRTPGIPESREGAGIDRGETKIVIEGETIVGIIAVMNRLIGTEIEGGMIAGGPKGIVTRTVRGADATGGDVMTADRLIHKGCGR